MSRCVECKVNEDDVWADEKKIGKCEVCGAKNVEVFASGFHVAFVCEKCLV